MTGESGPVESVQGVTHARTEPDKGLIGGVLDKLKETATLRETTPETPSVQATELPADDWYSQEMRGVSTTGSTDVSSAVGGNKCASCGYSNPESESYCENCGNKL